MRTRIEHVLAKVETVKGVDASPVVGTDAVLVMQPNWKLEGLDLITREAEIGSGTLSGKKSIVGGFLKTVTFDVRLKGSGVAGTPPEHGALNRMCARAETIAAGVSVTYDPVSDDATQETGTIYYNHEGMRHILTGCVGTYTDNYETNNVIVRSYTMTGHTSAPTDTAFVAPTFDTTVPLVAKGVAFTVGGYSSTISSLSFDAGNTVSMPKDMSSDDGYGSLGITAFEAKGSFDPLMVTGAVNDFYGDFVGGAALLIDTGVIGTVAGNRLQRKFPAATYTDISPGDRDGSRTYELPFEAKDVSGDDFETEIWT